MVVCLFNKTDFFVFMSICLFFGLVLLFNKEIDETTTGVAM